MRGNDVCVCGRSTVKANVAQKTVYRCPRCAAEPDLCRCTPREVEEFRSDEMWQHWMHGGDPLLFAMQRVARLKWRLATAGGSGTDGGDYR